MLGNIKDMSTIGEYYCLLTEKGRDVINNLTFNCYSIPFPCFSKLDVSPPAVGNSCPNTIVEYADRNSVKRIRWTEPYAIDNSGVTPMVHHMGKSPGDVFQEGNSLVTYIFIDGSGNTVNCSIQVTVSGK